MKPNCDQLLFVANVDPQVPQDRTIVRRVLRTVSFSLFVCMGSISVVGIVIALALIIFNIWFRQRR